MRVTADEVAKRAGVSVSTVSRALGAPGLVATSTRDRVQRIASELGYLPNRSAQHLVTGRTGSIALVVPDLENPHFSALAKGIQSRARDLGYSVYIADTDEDPFHESDTMADLARQVDGVIVCSARAPDDDVREYAKHTTVVLVDREVPTVASVISDQISGSRQIIRHLAALGHRRVALAAGPELSWTRVRREQAISMAAEELGLEPPENLGAFAPIFSGGVAAADLALGTPSTALILHNDLMAFGALQRLNERGVSVPEDISVVSYDDILLASISNPPLTSVRSAASTMARAATALLHRLLSSTGGDPDPVLHHTIATELRVRGSTGPVRS